MLERVGRYLAEAGATQDSVLRRLREQHGITWGVERLRAAADAMASMMDEHRQEYHVQRLLELLQQAEASRGRHRPVLSVGRDGITLWMQPHGFFEVATSATIAVFDRRGQRLGTVYLAYAPELGQGALSNGSPRSGLSHRRIRRLISRCLGRFARKTKRTTLHPHRGRRCRSAKVRRWHEDRP